MRIINEKHTPKDLEVQSDDEWINQIFPNMSKSELQTIYWTTIRSNGAMFTTSQPALIYEHLVWYVDEKIPHTFRKLVPLKSQV
jgi:hypothetical protein